MSEFMETTVDKFIFKVAVDRAYIQPRGSGLLPGMAVWSGSACQIFCSSAAAILPLPM